MNVKRIIIRYVVLLAILGAGLVPRLADLEHPSFTYDELEDYWSSSTYYSDLNINNLVSDYYKNGQLPFIISYHFNRWLGISPWGMRFISVLMSLLAVYAVFLLAESFWGLGWAAAAAAMLALSPFFIACSRLAFSHGHIFPVFFIVAAMLYLQKIMAGGPVVRSKLILYTAVCTGLAVGCDFLAVFFAVGFLALLIYTYRHEPLSTRLKIFGLYSTGVLLVFCLASPIHIIHFKTALSTILNNMKDYEALRGYLWLGQRVDSIPWYYYAVVMAVKFEPLVNALLLAGIILLVFNYKSVPLFHRLLVFSLWPVIYFSAKSWKTPYYLSIFIPVIYLIVVSTLKIIYDRLEIRGRKLVLAALLLGIFGSQIMTILKIHPDYNMLGIQYGEKFFGEFQGPAVSHNQWTGEALTYISKTSDEHNPHILIFDDQVGGPLIRLYSAQLGLTRVSTRIPEDRSEIEYIVINQDAKRMIAPMHPYAVSINKDLVDLAENSGAFKVVKVFYAADFPMVWIYKRP